MLIAHKHIPPVADAAQDSRDAAESILQMRRDFDAFRAEMMQMRLQSQSAPFQRRNRLRNPSPSSERRSPCNDCSECSDQQASGGESPVPEGGGEGVSEGDDVTGIRQDGIRQDGIRQEVDALRQQVVGLRVDFGGVDKQLQALRADLGALFATVRQPGDGRE